MAPVAVQGGLDLEDLAEKVLMAGLATSRLERLEVLHRTDRELISSLFETIGKLTEKQFVLLQALHRIADGHGDPVAVAKGALR